MATDELQSPLIPPRPRRVISAAAALSVAATLALVFLLVAGLGPFSGTSCRTSPGSSPPDPVGVELTLLAAAHDKGAVCLDGSPAGYHLQTGTGAGSRSWVIHLQGGGWCDTVRSCSDRTMTYLGSSKFMQKQVNFSGFLSNDPVLNPDFYSWNRVLVRYCDGASFAGDSQHEDGNGTLFFRGRRIWEAVLDELMGKGLAHSKQALLTGCSAGGLATLLHCNDFRARFPQEVTVKCFPDAGFFVDAKDLSGQRSMRSTYDGVVHLQNVTQVLPKDCLLANKDPTECFFPAELIKSINTPTFILNSAYDSWQIQVLNEFRKTMVDGLKAAEDNMNCSWFIDSCFTHCQSVFDNSQWNPPIAPRLGNKTLVQTVGDWYFGSSQSQVVREIGCEYPCNPTCN